MLDFPNAPNPNDVFNPGGGTLWKWDGSKWVAVPGGIPEGPSDGKFYARRNANWVNITDVPIAFTIAGKPAASAAVVLPVTIPLAIPANLVGTRGYSITVAAASAAFTLNKIAGGGGTTALGTITFTAATQAFTLSGAGGSLAVGDILQLIAPTTQDTALADIGIAVLAARA